MEENTYQQLGTRTLIFDIVRRSKIPFILLAITLVLTIIKIFYATDPASSIYGILGTLIFWGFLVTIAAFIILTAIAWLEYSMFQIRMDADIFKIRRGVFTKAESAIPYRRIESVDIRRTMIHQLFGVSRITIETTIDTESTSDTKSSKDDEVLPVIDHHLAQTIQEELTKRANVQKMRV